MSRTRINRECTNCIALQYGTRCVICTPCDRYGICIKCCLDCERRFDRREPIGHGIYINGTGISAYTTNGTTYI